MLLSFEITKANKIDSVELVGNTGGLDSIMLQEFIKTIRKADFKWIPALKNGKHINQYIAIPIIILFEFGDQPLEGEFLKVESYIGSYHSIMAHLHKLKRNYQLYPETILSHSGWMR